MNRVLPVLALFAISFAPPCLSAQERATAPGQVVQDRQLEYDAAKQQYEADKAEAERIRHVWDQLMNQHAAAHAREDDDEVRRLLGQLQERTGEKARAANALQSSREEWFKKGDALVSALDSYLETLDQQIRNSVGSDDEASRLYIEYERRLGELERELASEPREEVKLVMPEVEILPGDGPRDIAHKLGLLDNRVADYEDVLSRVDREIAGLTKRQAREQRRRDREARGERFDDNANPTGGVRTNVTDDAGVTDSAGVAVVKTLEERIAEKERFRQEVAELLDELKARAEEIRREAGGR